MKIILIYLISLSIFVSCKSNEPSILSYNYKNTPGQIDSITPIGIHLIRNCPDEYVMNAMPGDCMSKSKISNFYYIYKGQRKEIGDFDTSWVRKNCTVRTIVSQ